MAPPAYMEGRTLVDPDRNARPAAFEATTTRGPERVPAVGASPRVAPHAPVAATPGGYPTGGLFHVAPRVELRCDTEGSTIVYTTEREAPFYWRLYTGPFRMRPWTVTFSGLCNAPGTWHVYALEARFGIEERLYRLRCVEAWSITVPWIGYPLSKLIELAEPQSSARYVAFRSFHRPEQARGQESGSLWPWPYYEGLRLDEAMNELAFVVTGAYGEPLPKQNGAPLRLALPWKYGFKSIKGILEIEFTDTIPPTFWSDYAANEYGFYSNVNPDVPHPRWSQAEERQLYATTGGEQQPTLLFNGYSEFVGDLYDPELLTYLS